MALLCKGFSMLPTSYYWFRLHLKFSQLYYPFQLGLRNESTILPRIRGRRWDVLVEAWPGSIKWYDTYWSGTFSVSISLLEIFLPDALTHYNCNAGDPDQLGPHEWSWVATMATRMLWMFCFSLLFLIGCSLNCLIRKNNIFFRDPKEHTYVHLLPNGTHGS